MAPFSALRPFQYVLNALNSSPIPGGMPIKSHLKLIAPSNENREYLTPAEIDKLIEASGRSRAKCPSEAVA
jgi:hypothetical protein